jgi:hypothetical protein
MVEIFVEITYNEWVDGSTGCISTAESRAQSLKQLFGQKAQRNRRVAGPHYLTAEPDPNPLQSRSGSDFSLLYKSVPSSKLCESAATFVV